MTTTVTSHRIRIPQTIVEQVVTVTRDDGSLASVEVETLAVFHNHPAAVAYLATLNTLTASD
jgi:hypothetical protein